jgi:hypothetical protein
MLHVLEAAKIKLSFYYKETDKIYSDIFAIGTIVAPSNKLQFFSTQEWEGSWRERYHKSLTNYLKEYTRRLSDIPPRPSTQVPCENLSQIEILVSNSASQHRTQSCYSGSNMDNDELTKYLESGKY